ncbi:class I SAM-dependent methyltransferase [Geodermatophilus obscurus]|uniref:Methyltransferase type 11 n=1 Tax=Geodermatophilus obscurus (strain ATCC 25078 / DSM 43160 / JCM 3152 / CCUG 61914 / KCC A-0152 / KCTC 9177 / NBRC 13315 / NRRL B-3577 / G-20) TaxID=526225 RepID=D2S584_GEOOG|nr:methyltransferase domain-containing protein [Geodermatophilus obscurus]ADB73195.1 Methyltransferase type 11 [Geodermatophilus obscurus DSM 43160]
MDSAPTRLPIRVLRAVERRSALARRAKFRIRWAGTRRLDPLSEWGFDRGTAVDRYYIERFLQEHRDLVHGRTLEVKEDLYASSLGAEQVDVLDIDPTNPEATIVGDVCDPATLPEGTFDAAIVTQTLQLVPDPVAGLQNVLRALRPRATALVTAPAMSRLAGDWDRWRWTARGLQDLVDRAGGTGAVVAHGNQVVCRAFLLGAAIDDLPSAVRDVDDPDFPLIVTAVVRRGAT